MTKSIFHKYMVDDVPLGLLPVFYFFSYSIAVILFGYALLVHFTSQIEITGQVYLDARRNYIFCHWHTFIPLYGSAFLRNNKHVWMQHPFWYMKPIHLLLHFLGIKKIILGSTGHSGRKAADELVEYLKKGYSTVLLPDGPNGPSFVAKRGMLHISHKSGVPIIPIQFKASKYFESKGWDRKKWPLPFAIIKVKMGEPIQVSESNHDHAYTEISDALGCDQRHI